MSKPFCALASAIASTLASAFLVGQCATAFAQPTISLKVAGAESSKLQLKDGYELRQGNLKRSSDRQARSLSSGDIDGDGFPDLVSGYATDVGGVITLHRGNVEA